ncbi:hypothetical protein [Streptomyces uncialis]|uniref:hypothetical protein n=1 Tax=Streptomyces uncialis TaxID=1048205 RepID=UPI0037A3A050
MGLHSRLAQIVWGIVPIASAGTALVLPFVWRVLKRRSWDDIRTAFCFAVAQVAVYVGFSLDRTADGSLTGPAGAIIWLCVGTAMVGAAYVYRPLSKEELADRAARAQTRPGSSYLH